MAYGTEELADRGMKIVVVDADHRSPRHGENGRTINSRTMSTERKDTNHPVTDMKDRHATGKEARDEQTGATIGGLRELKDNWGETKSELRKDYHQLTEADLELKPGREQETIDRLGQRLHKTPEEAMKLVQDIAQRNRKPMHNSSASTAGTHTHGLDNGHRDMPEAAERKNRRDTPMDEQPKKKPQA